MRFTTLLIKQPDDYESIGGLFADIYEGVHEFTVVEKIWSIIIDVIAIVAEILTIDKKELIEQIIRDNRRLTAMQLVSTQFWAYHHFKALFQCL